MVRPVTSSEHDGLQSWGEERSREEREHEGYVIKTRREGRFVFRWAARAVIPRRTKFERPPFGCPEMEMVQRAYAFTEEGAVRKMKRILDSAARMDREWT